MWEATDDSSATIRGSRLGGMSLQYYRNAIKTTKYKYKEKSNARKKEYTIIQNAHRHTRERVRPLDMTVCTIAITMAGQNPWPQM